ncbi:hypothetical protein [Roseibium alexandrii]|uniref:hypothetical protein n=1 Tax=Roseibium alexandrii TaxID=388408 RepID=UPI0001947F22|nr:hypothetical protein [Roseibium alexandrii]
METLAAAKPATTLQDRQASAETLAQTHLMRRYQLSKELAQVVAELAGLQSQND